MSLNPLDFIPSGYATKVAGFLMLLGSAGLFADYAAQFIGSDVITSQVTTWPAVVAMFSAGLGLLGVRRAIENK